MNRTKLAVREGLSFGLDVGTDSCGWAVVKNDFSLRNHSGRPLWGSHVFENNGDNKRRSLDRRTRRRTGRCVRRIHLTQELFAKAIEKIDKDFFFRIDESALWPEDKTTNVKTLYFNDIAAESQYHKGYPTIHHLIGELIRSKEPHDVRLIYIAVAWLMKHRGHFLSDLPKDQVEGILDFGKAYDSFFGFFDKAHIDRPWDCNKDEFKEILLKECKLRDKEKAFYTIMYDGKKPADTQVSRAGIIKLLCGGTFDLMELFPDEEEELCENTKLALKNTDAIEKVLPLMSEGRVNLIRALCSLYDWAELYRMCDGNLIISNEKVKRYDLHKSDLAFLKKFIKKYRPNAYHDVFCNPSTAGYMRYVKYAENKKDAAALGKKVPQKEFCDYVRGIVKEVACEPEDQAQYEDMMRRLELYTFMPKQVCTENRTVPYQLHYNELKLILQNASEYLPFLNEVDEDGYSVTQKLLSIMTFRVPYYVGPLHSGGEHAWIVRRESGRIYPWNFDDKVDRNLSEEEFILRLIGKCTYVPGEKVMPKHSLLYGKFEVLDEINNIKINGNDISVSQKQKIYHLFEEYPKVSVAKIKDCLREEGVLGENDVLGGLDTNVRSSLTAYHDFKKYIESGMLKESEVEEIIFRLTVSQDRDRMEEWLRGHYGTALSDHDMSYISGLEYSGFGRLSKSFLHGIKSLTGKTVIELMWATNKNLNQILFSDDYGFRKLLAEDRLDYYGEEGRSVEQILDDMYCPGPVRRTVYRTLDVVDDLTKVLGGTPEKIYMEMARGDGIKGKRTQSRKELLQDLYKALKKVRSPWISKERLEELELQLSLKTEKDLQKNALFLYFLQVGRCLYSGRIIDHSRINDSTYVDYNRDHIYPRSKIKDDSMDNLVLVLSTLNGNKDDKYPIDGKIRQEMREFWNFLHKNKLLSDEKFRRLTRETKLTAGELHEFVARQLTETRQASKALTVIFNQLYPATKVVSVKSKLISEFRQEFDLPKSRAVNDQHHAKDAYLSVVCGSVWDGNYMNRFWLDNSYTVKTKTLYSRRLTVGDHVVWEGHASLGKVKKAMACNRMFNTRYTFAKNGQFFDITPVKSGKDLVPKKHGLDPDKYGGYTKKSTSYLMMVDVAFTGKKGPEQDTMIVRVDGMNAERVLGSMAHAEAYLKNAVSLILGNSPEEVEITGFPLGLRPIKPGTMFFVDGFRFCVTGISSGGTSLTCTSIQPLYLSLEEEAYVKRIETCVPKIRKSEKKEKEADRYHIDRFDKITREENLCLYDLLTAKLGSAPFNKIKMFRNLEKITVAGRARFIKLKIEDQCKVLEQYIYAFKTGRKDTVDLSDIGGKENSASFHMPSRISAWDAVEVNLVDSSSTGVFETRTSIVVAGRSFIKRLAAA